MAPARSLLWAFAASSVAWLGCGSSDDGPEPGEERAGGDTTSFSTSQDAYTQPASTLDPVQVGTFQVGNIFNGDDWVVAPASTEQRDGLGPVYNATSCSACHLRDGRGRPPNPGEDMLSMLVRLSIPGEDAHGGPQPEPHYGGQLQPRAIPGVPAEGIAKVSWSEEPGSYADGTPYSLRRPTLEITDLAFGPMQDGTLMSARIAGAQYGLGLVEAIAEQDVLAHADPNDQNGDGISGRPNYVWDAAHQQTALGRLGWKANVPSVLLQTTGALNGDIGITSPIFPDSNCADGQTACAAAPNGGTPEIEGTILDSMVFYGQT
ncbi:MAG TPA: di-heme oxidoredictase family protein, partial [Polyangiaceae bacterium]|nr:di-heme oxidoredictase family protein [Polyangiaceae bacterium]